MSWLYNCKEAVDALERSHLDISVLRDFNGLIPASWALKTERGLLTLEEHIALERKVDLGHNYDIVIDKLQWWINYEHYDFQMHKFYDILEYVKFEDVQDFITRFEVTITNFKKYRGVLVGTIRRILHYEATQELPTVDLNPDGTISWVKRQLVPRPQHEAIRSLCEVIKNLQFPIPVFTEDLLKESALLPNIVLFMPVIERPEVLVYCIKKQASKKAALFADIHEELIATVLHPDRLHRLGKTAFLNSF